MTGPSYEDQTQRWKNMVGYFKRGVQGEAGIELSEAVQKYKADEVTRWRALVEEYPFAITGVDPAESLRSEPEHCKLFESFVVASHQWLKEEFANRDCDYWEEMASFGCYWVRFKAHEELLKYKAKFSNELAQLQFSEPSS